MTKGFAKRALTWGLAGALTCAMAGCSYLLPTEEETLAPPLVETKEVEYVTVPVTRGNVVEQKKGNGVFRSSKTSEVFFEAADGRLAKILTAYGADVQEGDVLLELTADDLQYQYETAKIRYEIQEATLKRTSGSYNRKMQQYQVDLAKLELDHLEKKLANTQLKAPISGKITYLAEMKVGDTLEPYKSYISISDPSEVLLVVTGDSSYDFINGRDVTVKIKDQEFKGKVVQSPYDEPETLEENTDDPYAVFEVYDLPEELKTLGREAQVTMVANSREDVLTIPINVLREYNGRNYVQVLQDGVKMEKDVVVGLKGTMDNSTVYEIVSGLEEGEQVIVK